MFNYLILFLLLTLPSYALLAQNKKPDSARIPSATYVASLFYKSLNDQSPLYNGREYIDARRSKGHAFFMSDKFEKAVIWFDGLIFQDVPILYDIIKDQIVIRHPRNSLRLVLQTKHLEQFFVHGHHFIVIMPDTVNQIPAGIYDKLYDGRLVLLCRRRKLIEEKVSEVVTREVVEKDLYYILLNGTYHQVNNRRQLFKLLAATRKEIREHLRKDKINYKMRPEEALMKAASIYDRQASQL